MENLSGSHTKLKAKAIMSAYHSGNDRKKNWAVEQMININRGFIGFMISNRFSAFKADYYEDLYNECVVAIIENMAGFDPEEGTMTTYFTYPMIHAMSCFVNSVTNRCSSYYSGIMNKVRNAVKHFEKQHCTPSVSDIAFHTQLSIKKVSDAMHRINAVNEYHYSSDSDLDSIINEYGQTPEDKILEQENHEILLRALSRLPSQDRMLLQMRFGFEDNRQKSLSTISALTNLPVNQVAASISKSLKKLRQNPEFSSSFRSKCEKRQADSYDSLEIILSPGPQTDWLYDTSDMYNGEQTCNIIM